MPVKENEKWFKIKDVEQLTGIPRRTVHFYLQSGLLHPPKRTGKTMAYYDENHIRKLKDIVKLKQQGLPLIAIRDRISGVVHLDPAENQSSHNFHFNRNDNKNQKLFHRMEFVLSTQTSARLFPSSGNKWKYASDLIR